MHGLSEIESEHSHSDALETSALVLLSSILCVDVRLAHRQCKPNRFANSTIGSCKLLNRSSGRRRPDPAVQLQCVTVYHGYTGTVHVHAHSTHTYSDHDHDTRAYVYVNLDL